MTTPTNRTTQLEGRLRALAAEKGGGAYDKRRKRFVLDEREADWLMPLLHAAAAIGAELAFEQARGVALEMLPDWSHDDYDNAIRALAARKPEGEPR